MKKPKPKGERVWISMVDGERWSSVVHTSKKWAQAYVDKFSGGTPGITIRRATLTPDPQRRPK